MEKERDYLKEHPHKEGTFILCNIAGLEWQMLKDGEIFSSSPDIEKSNTMIAINNNDGIEDNKMLKKKMAAILREKIYNSIKSINELAEKSGYKDFDVTYDEIVELLKLKFELFTKGEEKCGHI